MDHYVPFIRQASGTPQQKRRANDAVRRALRKGELVRPEACSLCRRPPRRYYARADKAIVAHHWDYARPLDVIWLCAPCHVLVHRSPWVTLTGDYDPGA